MKLLFLTWDGPGTNYHESLFLPIFARLKAAGTDVYMLQFTWASAARSRAIARRCEDAGIHYESADVWRRPQPYATALSLSRGVATLVRHVRRHGIDVLMPRSIIPAGMALAARQVLPRARLFYDADGFMADERADFGGWSRHGLPYSVLRRIERAAVIHADAVMVRTVQARSILLDRTGGRVRPDKIHVIPNGKDERLFNPASEDIREQTREHLGLTGDTPLVVYAGSLGPQYHAIEMIDFFKEVRRMRPSARLLVLTGEPVLMERVAAAAGLPPHALIAMSVSPADVPRYLAAADLGLAFRTPCLSQRGVSPIKVGEYLLCGVPVLASSGIGDLDAQIDPAVGHLMPDLATHALQSAARWFLASVIPNRVDFRDTCRQRGVDTFGLVQCVSRYRSALDDEALQPAAGAAADQRPERAA